MNEAPQKHAGGRPPDYKDEFNDLAYKFCLLGATDCDLATFFDVTEKTINAWKTEHPEFCESLRRGKEQADANVAQSLYHRALGYSHPEDKIFNHNGTEMIVPTTKHYPPDSTAAIFWLKNRNSAKWRDKQEVDHTSTDGSMSPVSDTAIQRAKDIILDSLKPD